jgi:hypothetical protein
MSGFCVFVYDNDEKEEAIIIPEDRVFPQAKSKQVNVRKYAYFHQDLTVAVPSAHTFPSILKLQPEENRENGFLYLGIMLAYFRE